MIKAKLVVVGGDAKRTEVDLKQLPATIGRAKNASITLPHALVSRKHCEIFENGEKLFVKDLNSLNGTYLNNEKIQGSVPLLSGQLLTLGNVTFRAVYETEQELVGCDNDFSDDPGKFSTIENKNHNETIASDDASTERAPALVAVDPSEVETDHGDPASQQKKIQQFKTENTIHSENEADTDSHRFVLDDESIPVEKSVSFGAIDELPAQAPLASFAGNIESSSESPEVQVECSRVQLDLGEDESPLSDPSKSKLDDFFKKLPK